MSTKETSGVVSSGRSATELVVPGKGAKTKSKVLSLIVAAAQHLDSSCTDGRKRAVRLRRPDLLEVCANSDSPLVEAVDSAGGEGLRTSFWNGYDLTTRRGRERLYQFCSAKRPRHVSFSSPCGVSGAPSQRVSRILDGIAAVVPRVQALGCHVHFAQCIQLETEFVARDVREDDEGSREWLCLGLRDLCGSLLNRSWQVLTTSPDAQEVLNHRIGDKKHKHGRLSDLSSETSSQFPQSVCQTLAKQFLVRDSWHSVLGILEHLHPDEDERPPIPSSSSHESPIEMENTTSEMEVDRDVGVPPPALPPPALPPPAPPVVDASPNSSERKGCK